MISKPLDNETTYYFDVDETLVKWHPVNSTHVVDGVPLSANKEVVDYLIECKKQGCVTVVWSQGGQSWANNVVSELGLQKYVDYCLSKPCMYIDDVGQFMWMGEWIKVVDGKIIGKGFE